MPRTSKSANTSAAAVKRNKKTEVEAVAPAAAIAQKTKPKLIGLTPSAIVASTKGATAARKAPVKKAAGKLEPSVLRTAHAAKQASTAIATTVPASSAWRPVGNGSYDAPFDLPVRPQPNRSGCFHCPLPSCSCVVFADLLQEAIDETAIRRMTEVAGKNFLCAKSILPPFVARLATELNIAADDTFFDLGCGNGSVLFQVAFLTGAKCVSVELSPHNAAVAQSIWAALKPKLERASGRAMPAVEIIAGDLAEVINGAAFAAAAANGKAAIWTANLLMPRAVTHFMSERFRRLPIGTRIACFDDLYPHGRAVNRTRDPEAFELFDMTDFVWPAHSVEWTRTAGGRFHMYLRV